MKSADEILEMIRETIATLYGRPDMCASGPEAAEDVLWWLHVLWLRGMGIDIDHLHRAIGETEDAEARQAMNFSHFRRSRGGTVEDAEVFRYVVRMWREVDRELGLEIPPRSIEAHRP